MAAAKKKPHERVMEFVERELKKNPEIGSSDLFKKAKKVSRTVSGMTIRQFHAKYPLQVKRRLAPQEVPEAEGQAWETAEACPSSDDESSHGQPRGHPSDPAQLREGSSVADSQSATIEVLASLDKYVDRVVKAAG